MVTRIVFAAALSLALVGCQTTSGGKGGAFCSVEAPIRPSKDSIAHMSPAEAKSILEHNRHGQRECGWKP